MPSRCHLTIKAPSPCAIEYTVSTASRPENLRSHILRYSSILLRTLIGISILIAFLERFELLPIELFLRYGHLEEVPLWRFGLGASAVMFLVLRRWHTEESLLILRTLGIQTTTLSPSYLLPATTRFIPTSQIRDLYIHEAFKGFEVRYYLCVVVEGEGEGVVVFPKLLPNREILEQVWRGSRLCLYEPKE